MMHDDFVTLEQAIKLKEFGFDYKCNHYYKVDEKSLLFENYAIYSVEELDHVSSAYEDLNNNHGCISAPTLAQVQKWLREVKHIYLFVTMEDSCYYWYIGKEFQIGNHDSYEKALSEGISRALESLKRRERDENRD